MAGNRIPGPICGSVYGFDTDTLTLSETTPPGPVCSDLLEDMRAEAALRTTYTKPVKPAKRAKKKKHHEAVNCPQPGGELGSLSAHYESGSRGAAAIGYDSTGGWSYGKYQIATLTGTMDDFLDYVRTNAASIYQVLDKAGGSDAATKGTPVFKKAWTDLAADASFATVQHDFIKTTHYDLLAAKIKTDTGLDVAAHSAALRDVVWSVAVQHGPGSSVISAALEHKNLTTMTDEQIINAIYDRRESMITNKAGVQVPRYFPNSSEAVQKSVEARFKAERHCALQMLKEETEKMKASTLTSPWTTVVLP